MPVYRIFIFGAQQKSITNPYLVMVKTGKTAKHNNLNVGEISSAL